MMNSPGVSMGAYGGPGEWLSKVGCWRSQRQRMEGRQAELGAGVWTLWQTSLKAARHGTETKKTDHEEFYPEPTLEGALVSNDKENFCMDYAGKYTES